MIEDNTELRERIVMNLLKLWDTGQYTEAWLGSMAKKIERYILEGVEIKNGASE